MLTICLGTVLALVSQQAIAEPPRLDTSSEAALEASTWRMFESLPPSDGWNAHPLSLALDSLANTEGMAERDRASAAQGKKPEKVPLFKHLDGMTYQQIIATWHAREMRRRLEWNAENVRAGVHWMPPAPYRFPADPSVKNAPTPAEGSK